MRIETHIAAAIATVAATCALAVAAASAATTGLPQTQITSTPKVDDQFPAATDTYFTWDRNSVAHPGRYNTYARKFGSPAFKVNAPGTYGGSSGIDGTTIVYTQWKPGGHMDLRLFDVVTRTRSTLPAIVDTARGDEFGPSISGDWIEFRRLTAKYYREFIYNVSTHKLRMLDEAARSNRYNFIESGQVNGNYVAWMRCTRVTCKVKRYDIGAGTTLVVSPPPGRYQFGAAVTADGTLYYGEGSLYAACGRGVKLKKLVPGGSPTTLVSFPRGTDFYSTFAYTNVGGTDLYYARFRCSTNRADIFRVTSP